MKLIVFLWFLLAIDIAFAHAQRRPRPSTRPAAIRMRARPEMAIASITFLQVSTGVPIQRVGADQGILNLGTLSNVAQEDHNGAQIHPQKDSFVVVTRLGMRVDLPDSGRAGTATVSAYLLSTDPLRTVSLDGIRLSMTPEIIARHVSYGAITEHVLKVMVPASMPPGLLMDLIGVNVASN
jgi:hypothetical protein